MSNSINTISPLVSVIIPSYNHARYVEEAILSIVNQTYKNIELIVIDDGSKDNSVEIINLLAKKYNFKFLTQTNKGVSNTLNRGIEISKGEYICACASDDKFALEKVERQVHFLQSNTQYGICYTDRIKFYENGITRKLPSNISGSGDLFERLLSQTIRVCPGTIMYRRKVFDKVGFFDPELAVEDFDMILKVAKIFEIGHLQEHLFYYRSHAENTVNNVELMKVNSDRIIDKWAGEDCYSRAVVLNRLQYFRSYSSIERRKALKILPVSLLIFGEKVFYEGLIRLLVPKVIYKMLLKR